MLTGLLASAREVRLPLTVGYSVLMSTWILFGESLLAAAEGDPLGRRLISFLDSLGDAAQLGLITFVAAMLGSVLWHSGVARLVRYIGARADHPNWQELIDEARVAARQYGEYRVVTYKSPHGDRPSPFDQEHTVPSTEWGSYLVERVRERERKAAEMSFRVTLALALVPLALALAIDGGGLWWLSLLAVPVVWFDVALLKYSTLRVANRYKLEDLHEQLRRTEEALRRAQKNADSATGPGVDNAKSQQESERLSKLQEEETRVRAEINTINAHTNRRASRIFALVEGAPAE